jgi:lactocepin
VAPSWHPDASRIAVATRDAASGYRLTVVGALSGEAVAVSDHPDASRGGRLTWTPDGGQVAFDVGTADADCDCTHWDTWVLDLDARARHQVDADGDDRLTSSERHPVFAPGIALRRAGVTRIETALAISRDTFDAARVAVLAREDLYADALTGAPLAHAHDAPLLLTPTANLHSDVGAELLRLGVETVFLLGSEAALTTEVVDDLEDLGITDVRRRGGANRAATARLIAKELGPSDHAFVVEGRDADPNRGWPDAVSVSPLAAAVRSPILLTETEVLPGETARALEELEVERVTLIGGEAAIGAQVSDSIESRGVAVDRLAGEDRYATSLEVADAGVAAGLDPARTWFATGRNWPDALGAGPAVAATGAVLVLLDGFDLDGSPQARTWLDTRGVERIVLVGGPDAIDPRVAVEIERRAGP